mmetsp:Transcript_37176/g.43245  ORF Transcript_37176/g.43245 Transcript_37176/m.43245 type:complete len:292 (+) Transcript_37176:61-936(+)
MKDDVPSQTAFFVSLCIVALKFCNQRTACPIEILDANYVALLETGVVPIMIRLCMSNHIVAKIVVRIAFFLSGNFHRFAFGLGQRKAYMDKSVSTAIENSKVTQVLVVGGGYDTLAMRLAWKHPSVAFFELDHPATGKVKDIVLTKMGKAPNMHVIRSDLTKVTLKDALLKTMGSEYDVTKKTITVAEGLTMYLSEADNKKLFSSVAEVVGKQSLFCFDFLPTNDKGESQGMYNSKTSGTAKSLGENFLFKVKSGFLERFFEGSDWKMMEKKDNEVYRDFRYMTTAELISK